MKLKFSSGNIEDLMERLIKIVPKKIWIRANNNTYQAKLKNGAVINYYITTGIIFIQGKENIKKEFENLVKDILEENVTPPKKIREFINKKSENSIPEPDEFEKHFLSDEFKDTEIVIGLVGAIGVEYKSVIDQLKERLKRNFKYECHEIRVSSDVIEKLPIYAKPNKEDEFSRISHLMDVGNMARKEYGENSILAMGCANIISQRRTSSKRTAYIVNSLKHPDEVKFLREIYGHGFYLVGVFSDVNMRSKYLTDDLKITNNDAEILMNRDEDDKDGHGQHTSDTFHLSDFFVYIDNYRFKLKNSINRFLDIIFGRPTSTPLFEEYAMFMAFTSSLRSADLSRQVGAIIAHNNEIVATGANDCPKYGGGLYWPFTDKEGIKDYSLGRDFMRGEDSNIIEKNAIINDIIKKIPSGTIDPEELRIILSNSKIKDLTEYGRVVHAEMEALLVCARNSISTKNSDLFCTTFPCHNCAKHIIAAGVSRVIYIEPYPKSKALNFHSESIKLGFKEDNDSESFVYFEPFVGVGPRKFFDLFSMNLGSGRSIKRKDKDGKVVNWNPENAKLKIPLLPLSYLDKENRVKDKFNLLITKDKP